VEQELHTRPEHLSSPPVFSGVRVTRSLVLYVCFVVVVVPGVNSGALDGYAVPAPLVAPVVLF
jgi:hypothetical protein